MGKSTTIDKFFQRKRTNQLDPHISNDSYLPLDDNLPTEILSQKFRKVESAMVDLNLLERDQDCVDKYGNTLPTSKRKSVGLI